MKLDPRTGEMTPAEGLEILQNYLEQKFNCQVKIWAEVEIETKDDPSDWRGEFGPIRRAVFKGFKFQLEE